MIADKHLVNLFSWPDAHSDRGRQVRASTSYPSCRSLHTCPPVRSFARFEFPSMNADPQPFPLFPFSLSAALSLSMARTVKGGRARSSILCVNHLSCIFYAATCSNVSIIRCPRNVLGTHADSDFDEDRVNSSWYWNIPPWVS